MSEHGMCPHGYPTYCPTIAILEAQVEQYREALKIVDGYLAQVGGTRANAAYRSQWSIAVDAVTAVLSAPTTDLARLRAIEKAASETSDVWDEDWPMFRTDTLVPAEWYRRLGAKLDVLGAALTAKEAPDAES